jgi:uncharacterized DUF497 family protein
VSVSPTDAEYYSLTIGKSIDVIPPTLWFIAETNAGRPLKVVFQVRDGNMHVIIAHEANDIEMRIYEAKGK